MKFKQVIQEIKFIKKYIKPTKEDLKAAADTAKRLKFREWPRKVDAEVYPKGKGLGRYYKGEEGDRPIGLKKKK